MIYLFVPEKDFIKEYYDIARGVSKNESYYTLTFKDNADITRELNKYTRYDKESKKSIVKKIRNGESPNTLKEDLDETGRKIIRTAATIKGWHYSALFFTIETSTGSIYCKDYLGNDINHFNVIRYDENGQKTENDIDVVKTVVTWKPDYDYEIISGNIKQASKASQDVYLSVTGGLFLENMDDIPYAVKPFVQSMNLAFFEETRTDGRASKYMKTVSEGAPFPTNRFQYTFDHAKGFTHKTMISVEIFRQ